MELDLTLGVNSAADQDLIKDTDTENFIADVVEASQARPVIVDFWAEWCGPCKSLTPILEKLVRAAGGKVRLVKVDVDKNQMIAQQMRVQSIPTVFGFVGGQPVDGFAGNVPESQIKTFIENLIRAAGPLKDGQDQDLEDLLTIAGEALDAGQVDQAAALYSQIVQQDKENAEALAGLARCALAAQDYDRARKILALVPPEKQAAAAVRGVEASLALVEDLKEAGDPAAYRAQIDADPNDHEARYNFANALAAQGEMEDAADQLLEIVRRDRNWREGKARTQLLKIFDALGPEHPFTQNGRRRLSSILFA